MVGQANCSCSKEQMFKYLTKILQIGEGSSHAIAPEQLVANSLDGTMLPVEHRRFCYHHQLQYQQNPWFQEVSIYQEGIILRRTLPLLAPLQHHSSMTLLFLQLLAQVMARISQPYKLSLLSLLWVSPKWVSSKWLVFERQTKEDGSMFPL